MTAALSLVPVEEPAERPSAQQELAAHLRDLADLIELGVPWTARNLVYAPPCAAVVTLVTIDGEPVVLSRGIGNIPEQARAEVLEDVALAIDMTRHGRTALELRERWKHVESSRSGVAGG